MKGLKSYLNELSRKKVKNTKAKLVFIGNSNVGKSNLVASLLGHDTSNIASTHGAEIYKLDFEDDNYPLSLQIWDLGGQELYFGTHRVFMMSEGIKVLVYDYETESISTSPDRLNPNENVRNIRKEYYYQKIKELSPNSKIITVENKIDLHPNTVQYHYPHFKTSVEKNRNIAVLKAQIWEEGRELNIYGIEVPYYWELVASEIVELAENKKIISKEEFYSICQDKNVLEEGYDDLLQYLNDIGTLFYNNELENQIIIDLQWALQAIYKVFERKSKFYQEMRSRHTGQTLIRTFFDDFDNTELKLNIDEKWLFYRFLKSSGLCFSLDRQETLNSYIVFPEFLTNKKPETVALWQLKKGYKLKIRKKYDFLPYYPLHGFISKFGKKSSFNKFWRKGILIYTDDEQYSGFLIEADYENHTITVEIDSSVLEWQSAIVDCIEDFDENNQGTWEVMEEILDETQKESESTLSLTNLEDRLFKENHPLQQTIKSRKLVISYASEDVKELAKIERYLKANNIDFWYDKKLSGRKAWDGEIENSFKSADGYLILLSSDFMNPDKEFICQKEIPLITEGLKSGKYCQILCVKAFTLNESHKISKINIFNKGEVMPPLENDSAVSDFLNRFITQELLLKF